MAKVKQQKDGQWMETIKHNVKSVSQIAAVTSLYRASSEQFGERMKTEVR